MERVARDRATVGEVEGDGVAALAIASEPLELGLRHEAQPEPSPEDLRLVPGQERGIVAGDRTRLDAPHGAGEISITTPASSERV